MMLRALRASGAILRAALFCATALWAGAASADWNQPQASAYLDRRLVTVFHEGMELDDLVLGARGKITLMYVDSKLGETIQRLGAPDRGMPSESARYLLNYTGGYGSRRGHTLFVAAVQAFKSWTFDTTMLRVAGFTPSKDDFASDTKNPAWQVVHGRNEFSPDHVAMFSFYVPNELLARGEQIEVGYGDDVKSWKVPDKRE